MTKTTFVCRDGKLIEKPKRSSVDVVGGPVYMRDIEPFTMVEPDNKMVEISSRSALRAFERKHQIRQVGTDLKPLVRE